MVEMGEEHRQAAEEEELFNVEDAGERKLLSRYGIWLLVELCRPQEDIPIVSKDCFNPLQSLHGNCCIRPAIWSFMFRELLCRRGVSLQYVALCALWISDLFIDV